MKEIRKVLLVDDEPDIRMIAVMSLEKLAGWETVSVGSGREALARVESDRPDVILLDVMMPDMDGPTTFTKLREIEALADVPVIFLTAKVQKAEVARYLELGASGVIQKPFDPLNLAKEVTKIVEKA